MANKRRIYELVGTVIIFFFGIAFQYFFELRVKDSTGLALVIIIIAITFIILILIDLFHNHESRFRILDKKLDDIINLPSVKIEFIEDNFDGKSFDRISELIERATSKLLFASPWEPTAEYEAGILPQKVGDAKRRYYETIKKQVDKFRGTEILFHKRIMQVPLDMYLNPSFTYTKDSSFVDYLYFVAKEQAAHSRNCQIRIVSKMITSNFTIIDDKYVVLTTYVLLKSGNSVRHGAVVIEDEQGELVKYYNFLFQSLDAHSRPLEPQQIILKQP